jgi:hypothetical protein
MALLYTKQEETSLALPFAIEAAHIFEQIGSPHSQMAQELVDHLQGRDMPASEEDNLIETILDAFISADSLQDLQKAVNQYPILKKAEFIDFIQEIGSEQVPPELKPEFEQRLIWLRQIANQK